MPCLNWHLLNLDRSWIAMTCGPIPVSTVLSLAMDMSVLMDICASYLLNSLCTKIVNSKATGVKNVDGLWYIGSHLVIPWYKDLQENLFCMSHDCLGHFRTDKSYATLCDSYYWPNMQQDLEMVYVLGCIDCQKNKSQTTKPARPLHPLPVLDKQGDSVAIDFMGPLPIDRGFNMICSMTDHLGSDIQLIPTISMLTADGMALLFFNHWYCKNGPLLMTICDWNKLFISLFWKVLYKLIGVSVKMSSAYHPETDGVSEWMNNTVNQSTLVRKWATH